jgi:transposase
MEVDLVAHGGASTEGEYLHSLNLIDIETRWNEFVGLVNRSQASVTAAVEGCRRRLPFRLLGLDSDNGAEFINNGNLWRYCTLMKEDAPQWDYPLREVFNGLRYIVRTGMQWRFMPNDLPPWHTVYQHRPGTGQTQRWVKADVFEDMVRDLRMLLRELAGRNPQPSAAIFDGRTLQSSPESGARAG